MRKRVHLAAGGSLHTAELSPSRVSARALPWLSRRTGFWAIAFSFLAVAAFSTAPSSLYGLYEQQEHLSSLTITIVYAVYALGIVVSLLLAGHVSDWYGRRAVLLPALAVAVVAAVIFLTWRSLAGVIVARVLTGLALGAAVATATAFVTNLDAGPDGVATRRAGMVATIANIGGLALGPLIAGLLARYAGHGLTLPFIVFLALLLAAVGLGIVLQHLSPRVTLLIFAVAVAVVILAAAPILIRPQNPAAPRAARPDQLAGTTKTTLADTAHAKCMDELCTAHGMSASTPMNPRVTRSLDHASGGELH
jgi:MFS family permease